MKNLRFNRKEMDGQHQYLDDFEGLRNFGDIDYSGYIKCKLVHNSIYSIVLPDQIYLDVGGEIEWIQPLYFSGNLVAMFDEFGVCDVTIDISYGAGLHVRFRNDEVVSRLDDGSLLYNCSLKGPVDLYQYTTGTAKVISGKPFLKLYHHTEKKSKKGILESNEFWSSNWNIQGTKKSTNISYLYLTSLPEILCTEDLAQIAMSTQGKLAFRIDSNFTNQPDLILDVYRESTDNRRFTLSFWVEASLLATQPCYRHLPPDGFGYHAIVSPFIHRIGVEFGEKIKIENDRLVPTSPKCLRYAVVGNATNVQGLKAPFDEENTQEILKVEHIKDPDDIISFWIKNGNTNQYDNKPIERGYFS